jgi:Sporulation and spore germination
MKLKIFIAAILLTLTISIFAQNQKIYAVKIQSEPDGFGGKVVITVNGKKQEISENGYLAWIVNDGKAVVYSDRDGSGGFENEGQSLKIYDIATGKIRKILSEYVIVSGITEKRLSNGKNLLLVRLEDGGLGGSYFAVVDSIRGEIFYRDYAEVLSIKGDTVKLGYYKDDDWEKMWSARGDDIYQNKTAIPKPIKIKPFKTEVVDLKSILKNKVIINKNSFEMYESKMREVNLYFWRFNDDDGSKPFVLGTAQREVDAKAPLSPTLEALFRGATKNEEDKGFGSSTFGMKFEGVVLKGGVATVKFSQPPNETNYGSMGPFIFLESIEKTAKQFPSVKKVVVCAVGETMIDSELDKQFPRCK